MKFMKQQYRILVVLHMLVMAMLMVNCVLLWNRTKSVIHFDMLMMVFALLFLFFIGKQRLKQAKAQLDEDGLHITAPKQYIGIVFMIVALLCLGFYMNEICNGELDFLATELPVVLMLVNYEFYGFMPPVMIVKEQECFVGIRWFAFDDIEEIYIEPRRKDSRELVIYTKNKKRYAQLIKKELLDILVPHLPKEKIKEVY